MLHLSVHLLLTTLQYTTGQWQTTLHKMFLSHPAAPPASHQSLPVPVLEKHSLRVASILYLRRTPLITPMQPHRLASPASQWFCRQNDTRREFKSSWQQSYQR